MDPVAEQYKHDVDYVEKINELCDRYDIDDDTERLLRRRDDYWERIVSFSLSVISRLFAFFFLSFGLCTILRKLLFDVEKSESCYSCQKHHHEIVL